METIKIVGCPKVSDEFFALIKTHWSDSIKSIHVEAQKNVTQDAIQFIAGCPVLASLEMINIGFTSIGQQFSFDDAVLQFAEGSPLLKHINIPCCRFITDQVVSYFFDLCPLLESLYIPGSANISDESLAIVALNAPDQMLALDVSQCPRLTRSGFDSLFDVQSNLQSVFISYHNSAVDDDLVLKLIVNNPNLQQLDLKSCPKLYGHCLLKPAINPHVLNNIALDFNPQIQSEVVSKIKKRFKFVTTSLV